MENKMTKTSKFMTTMKKMLISKRAGILSIALSVSLLAYQSCTNERPVIDEFREDKYLTESTKDLKQAYSLEYKELSMRSEAMSDSIFGFQGLEPQWHLSRTITVGDSIEITEVPLNAQFAKLPFSETLASLDLDRFASKGAYTHLIQRKHLKDDSKTLNFFMNVMPDSTMLLSGKELRHSPGLLPLGFSGDVMFFDLSGTIRRKHSYSDGVLTHEYEPIFRDSSLRAMVIERCDWVLSYEYVEVGLPSGDTERRYSNYSYSVHCTTQVFYACLTKDPNSGGGGGGGGRSFTNINIDAPSPEVKMSDEFKTSKLECIYNKLINSSGFIRTIRNRFQLKSSKFNLNLNISKTPLPEGIYARTENNGVSVNVDIIFDADKMAILPNIQYALIIAHEMIHAMIYLDILERTHGVKEREDVKEYYRKKDLTKIYDYFGKKDTLKQHEYMSYKIVDELSSALKNFYYNKKGNKGRILTDKDFEALAWQGLYKTKGWEAKGSLEREDLKNRLSNLKNDKTFYIPEECQ